MELLGKLFNDIQHYPSWFKNGGICSLITNAEELGKEKIKNREWERGRFVLKGQEYICAFEEHDCSTPDSVEQHGTFELYIKDKKVLALAMAYNVDQYYSEWRPFKIEAFIEGDWVRDFKELRNRSEKETKEKLDNILKKPIDKLKQDFDIS